MKIRPGAKYDLVGHRPGHEVDEEFSRLLAQPDANTPTASSSVHATAARWLPLNLKPRQAGPEPSGKVDFTQILPNELIIDIAQQVKAVRYPGSVSRQAAFRDLLNLQQVSKQLSAASQAAINVDPAYAREVSRNTIASIGQMEPQVFALRFSHLLLKNLHIEVPFHQLSRENQIQALDLLSGEQAAPLRSVTLDCDRVPGVNIASISRVINASRTRDTELHVSLRNYNLTSEGASTIADALPGSKLTSLNVAWNWIGAAGATALAGALPESKLTSLDVCSNQIGDVGATALAGALPESKLTSLNVNWNQIGAAGATALTTAVRNANRPIKFIY